MSHKFKGSGRVKSVLTNYLAKTCFDYTFRFFVSLLSLKLFEAMLKLIKGII